MKKVSIKKAKEIGDKLNIDFNVIPLGIWKKGMNVELEHGKIHFKTNVTNDDLLKTGKIALAHLFEDIFYYERLEKMEEEAKKFWKGKKMPSPIKKN